MAERGQFADELDGALDAFLFFPRVATTFTVSPPYAVPSANRISVCDVNLSYR